VFPISLWDSESEFELELVPEEAEDPVDRLTTLSCGSCLLSDPVGAGVDRRWVVALALGRDALGSS
jgi:hypothetical protein